MSEEFDYYYKNGLQIKTIKTGLSKYRPLYSLLSSLEFTRQNAGKCSSGYSPKQYFPGEHAPGHPPPQPNFTSTAQICSLYCIGQILGLDPALNHYNYICNIENCYICMS